MNYNIRMLITAQPVSIDELMKTKMLFEKTSIEEFGKENVHCTKFFKSEKYENIGFYLYVNIPKEYQTQLSREKTEIQPIELKEVKEDASNR